MADDVFKASFKCLKCGPTKLDLPEDYTDADHAKCGRCGADFGAYGDIKKKAMRLAKSDPRDVFRDYVKGRKGWTLK